LTSDFGCIMVLFEADFDGISSSTHLQYSHSFYASFLFIRFIICFWD
jgi:hypothetical protein